ncbi:MAG TPA: ATP-binding cassette domain-containing protein [Ignavibacteria bacterium]
MSNLLEVDSVRKEFGTDQVLTDIFLKCQSGDVIGLLGRNGSGKSTLLKIIFGTLYTDHKFIRINDKRIDQPFKTKNKIAYLSQDNFLPQNITVKQVVKIYFGNNDQKEILDDEVLTKVANTKIQDLSGGESRYLEVKLLLNMDTQFVLLDEPFNGISPLHVELLKKMILDQSLKKGIILTDHDYRSVLDVANRYYVLFDGGLKKVETKKDLIDWGYVPDTKEAIKHSQDNIIPFDVDKQTIRDLELFPDRRNDNSIYSFYKRTTTVGGQELLHEMFNAPVSDFEFLQNRKNEIAFFFENNLCLELNSDQLDFIEYYLRNQRVPLKDNIIDASFDGVKNKLKLDRDYYTISKGILHIIQLLSKLKLFLAESQSFPLHLMLNEDLDKIRKFVASKTLKKALSQTKDLSFSQINRLDQFFRVSNKNSLRELLETVYKIDVLQSLSKIMKSDGFTLPDYRSGSQPLFEVISAFHPLLSTPIPNSFIFKPDSNLCFLTGPNMSGKSTFLKTIGLHIYLAHLGFPVPAKKLKISVFDGLFTTINLTDNLNLGYSHFYSEVKRVKDIVLKINSQKNLIVIFDELFRGTNVKDAYDASLIIISTLAKIRDNLFFISTHLLEVAENLDKNDSIMFNCFESELINQKPLYDFKIKEGISKERIGMLIIRNENIIDILEEIVRKQKNSHN